MTAGALTYLTVPAGTRATTCRACDETIYFVVQPSGKKAPIDCAADHQCHAPSATEDGVGVNHFTTCADPNRFHRRA